MLKSSIENLRVKITETQRKKQMKQLTDQELNIIANIIDAGSKRGIFSAADMKTIGELFNKIVAMLPKPEVKDDGKK